MQRASVLLLVAALVGVALACAAVFLPWWTLSTDWNPMTVDGTEYHFQATAQYYAGPDYRFWCTTNSTSEPGWGTICPRTSPPGVLNAYQDPLLDNPHLATVYADLLLVAGAAFLLGVVGLLVILVTVVVPRRRGRRLARVGGTVLLAAGLLALLAPVALVFAEPSALAADLAAQGGPTAEGRAFWGSCHSGPTPTSCGVNTTETWGAGAAWYLSVAGGGAFLIAALLERAQRRGSPPPVGAGAAPAPG